MATRWRTSINCRFFSFIFASLPYFFSVPSSFFLLSHLRYLGPAIASVLAFGGMCKSGKNGAMCPSSDTTWQLHRNETWVHITTTTTSDTSRHNPPSSRYQSTMASLTTTPNKDEKGGFTVVMLGGKTSGTTPQLRESWTYGPYIDNIGRLTSGWLPHAPAATPSERAMASMES